MGLISRVSSRTYRNLYKTSLKMAPPAFNDFGADCENLFNEHHNQGSVSYGHKGKMCCGADYNFALKNETGSKDLTWDVTANCHNMEIKYDHLNTVSKKTIFQRQTSSRPRC